MTRTDIRNDIRAVDSQSDLRILFYSFDYNCELHVSIFLFNKYKYKHATNCNTWIPGINKTSL